MPKDPSEDDRRRDDGPVGPSHMIDAAENKKIEAAVRKWKIKKEKLSKEDLDAIKYLFESLMRKEKESDLRVFMEAIYGHIWAVEDEMDTMVARLRTLAKQMKGKQS